MGEYLTSNNLYPSNEVSEAVARLQKHVVNKNFYTKPAYSIIRGGHIINDLSRSNQRRSWYRETTFDGAILDGVGFSDCIFYLTKFLNAQMKNTNMKNSVFYECTFQTDKPVFYTGFKNSVFTSCNFRNIVFDSSSFGECRINNTHIENCTFHNTGFDGAILNNCLLSNVTFKNMNLEFVEFRNVKFDSVALPFNSVPYIFNGLSYLFETKDNVYIKSAQDNRGYISIQEYKELLPDLQTYFEATDNYFPLANILIAKQKFDDALTCIVNGIVRAIQVNSLPMLHAFCRTLQVTNYYTFKQKHDVYQIICEQVNENTIISDFLPYRQINMADIKNILFTSNDGSDLSFRIQTTIIDDDYESIQLFYTLAHNIICSTGIMSGYSIQYSYNSSAEIFVFFNQLDPAVLAAMVVAFTNILSIGATSAISSAKLRLAKKDLQTKIDDSHSRQLLNEQVSEKHRSEIHLLELESKIRQEELQRLYAAKEKNKSDNYMRVLNLLDKIEQRLSNIESLLERLQERNVRISGFSHNVGNLDHDSLSKRLLELIYSPSKSDHH